MLVSRFAEFHRLGAYLNRYTSKPIGIVLGVPLLEELFHEKWYESLDGGTLEAFGRLFKNRIRRYAYPCVGRECGAVKTAEDADIVPHLDHLYRYVLQNRFIRLIPSRLPPELLRYSARQFHGLIASGEDEEKWKPLVREVVTRSSIPTPAH